MKIIEIVKFNDGYAYVLDENPTMVYHEEMVKDKVFGVQRMLIGQNEAGMMDFLTHHYYGNMKAFAGREFEIQMEDGSKRIIKDVWWDEGATRWQDANGIKLVDFTHKTFDDLVDCCVFVGGTARKDVLEKLLDDFEKEHPNYKVWDYYEFHDYCRKVKEETYVVCPKCRRTYKGTENAGKNCTHCGREGLVLLSEFNPFSTAE